MNYESFPIVQKSSKTAICSRGRIQGIFALMASLVLFCSCVHMEPPEVTLPETELTTTGVGAATGAAIGAGLGAIVGSATGNAGEGVVIGAVAGAATGGIVGHKLETHEEALFEAEENLERQEQLLDKQRRDLEELKQNTADPVLERTEVREEELRQDIADGVVGRTGSREYLIPPSRQPAVSSGQQLPMARSHSTTDELNRRTAQRARLTAENIAEPDQRKNRIPVTASSLDAIERTEVTPRSSATRARKSVVEKKSVIPSMTEDPQIASLPPAKAPLKTAPALSSELAEQPKTAKKEGILECRKAESEATRARKAVSDADKLFYFRRAVRLCPNEPKYHVEMGNVYQNIGRDEDAQYEYQLALDLDPNYEEAKTELNSLGATTSKAIGAARNDLRY